LKFSLKLKKQTLSRETAVNILRARTTISRTTEGKINGGLMTIASCLAGIQIENFIFFNVLSEAGSRCWCSELWSTHQLTNIILQGRPSLPQNKPRQIQMLWFFSKVPRFVNEATHEWALKNNFSGFMEGNNLPHLLR
jgi:hypothetical protein